MSDQEIRGKILEDLYNRKRRGQEILSSAGEYAKLLNISVESATFNMQYLIGAGLVQGDSPWHGIGSTRKSAYITDLTNLGYEAVEGRRNHDYEVNFNVINVNAPITGSQIAAGSNIEQTQSLVKNTMQDLERYLEQHFQSAEIEALKIQLRELEGQMRSDAVKPSTLRKIKEIVTSLGPAALVVMDFISKILGLGRV